MTPPKKRRLNAPTAPASPDVNQQLEEMAEQLRELSKKSDELPATIQAQIEAAQKFATDEHKATALSHQKMIEELQKHVTEPKKQSYLELFPAKEKKFLLRHTFQNVSNADEGVNISSEAQNFFGTDWKVYINRRGENLGLWLVCVRKQEGEEYSVATNTTWRFLKPNGANIQKTASVIFEREKDAWGFAKLLKWDNELKEAVHDEINVEMEVIITKMTGSAKSKPRSFDENQREFADVCLTVEGEDFYVLKKFLASRSGFFNGLFFSKYVEANKDQLEIPGIDARDFQIFLEAVYGEAELDDSNVEGLLRVADMYISPYALNVCEKFLLGESNLTSEKKYELSKQYMLEKLADKCISEIEDVNVIRAELQNKEATPSLLRKLGEQSVVLYQKLEARMREAAGAAVAP